jgi:hypothetical protein
VGAAKAADPVVAGAGMMEAPVRRAVLVAAGIKVAVRLLAAVRCRAATAMIWTTIFRSDHPALIA